MFRAYQTALMTDRLVEAAGNLSLFRKADKDTTGTNRSVKPSFEIDTSKRRRWRRRRRLAGATVGGTGTLKSGWF